MPPVFDYEKFNDKRLYETLRSHCSYKLMRGQKQVGNVYEIRGFMFRSEEHYDLYDRKYERVRKPFRKVRGKPRVSKVKEPIVVKSWRVRTFEAYFDQYDLETRELFPSRASLKEFAKRHGLTIIGMDINHDHLPAAV